ncbi:DUF3413 domain-containing protein [Marinomonas sp. A79]|uniref:DUF3413 domain-containing protein n=2 Tax=Marinomonas vulgaris TaxID=2823372 RepID=A0ABS5HCR0_9GAMM|nr:DUF3413 domain-containing protein [Marinomonas vulgaris]
MRFFYNINILKVLMVFDVFLASLISLRYYYFLPDLPSNILSFTFVSTSILGQMFLLSFIFGCFLFPLVILPKRIFSILIGVISALIISLLIIDTFVFSQYRFHINEVVLKLALSGDVVDFSILTWVSIAFGFSVILALKMGLIFNFFKMKIKVRYFFTFFFICLLASNFIHIWAHAYGYRPVTITKSYLPLFYPATANSFMSKHGLIDEEVLERQKELTMKSGGSFQYPIKALEFNTVKKPIDIIFIVVDSWRFDTFNSDNTPHIWDYAKKGISFNSHMSTGNATLTGIFGLFYGLPGTYWESALSNGRSPVFIDRLQQLEYELGIFTSASLENPEFNRTIFSNVNNLRLRSDGNTPAERDLKLTDDWLAWYGERDSSKASFSFLFYDAPHGYDFPNDYDKKYEPMLASVNYLALNNDTDPTLFMNRYRTSVRYVDELVDKVLTRIDENKENDTLIVITGDHAQELNDNKLNYWGHNSNFTASQIQVPFVIVDPRNNRKENYSVIGMTSHEDVIPTVMKNYLGVSNKISDYSNGIDLLNVSEPRDWLISSSYSKYALISEESILEVGVGGQYTLYDLKNRVKEDQQLNFEHLKDALDDISRFRK